MKGLPPLPGYFLQRLAERFCTTEACQRLLFPMVADLQFEWQNAPTVARRVVVRLRGAAAFARAFAPALALAAVGHLRCNAWGADPLDREAGRRSSSRIALATMAVALVLTADQAWTIARRLDLVAVPLLLLLPAVLALALPVGCLLGTALAAGPRPRWRPLLGTASLAGLTTFALAGWVVPPANQAYRERIVPLIAPHLAGRPLARGDRERAFVDLRARYAERQAAGDEVGAARAAVEWHKKPALGAACLALALTGLALAGMVRRPAARVLLGLPVAAGYFVMIRLAERAALAGQMPPALAMWGPGAPLLLLALLMAERGARLAGRPGGR